MKIHSLVVLLPLLAVSVFSSVTCHCAPKGPVFRDNLDSDGDGLSDYQEHYKYFTDPSKKYSATAKLSDGDWNQRKQFTYTITSVMRLLPPVRLTDMNDDYQDARLIRKDGDLCTVEITYYPLNKNSEAIGENPNWKKDYAGMTEYLKPRPAANWDEKMQSDLIAELKKSGIDPDSLTDKALVERVSQWVMGAFKYNDSFTTFYVYFPNGKPKVYPTLREAFDAGKPDPKLTDQQMFSQEILGKEMFYNKVHGQCTSTAVLMATVMRALGIPTRIIICIPPADPNDDKQLAKLSGQVHHNKTRTAIEQALKDRGGFMDHMFNEVYINHHWVRLSYSNLGQNTLDMNALGLMTHVYTCYDLSDMPLPQTWGKRFARIAYLFPSLSSTNPYMLVSVKDQFGKYSHVENPEIPELQTVTIDRLFWREEAQTLAGSHNIGQDSDLFAGAVEWIPDQSWVQLAKFKERASASFVLRAPGQPDVHASVNGDYLFATPGDRSHDGMFRGFGLEVSPADLKKIVPGIAYDLVPINNKSKYQWKVSDSVSISLPSQEILPH
ncbi:MAG TPA: transglutaminase domain-containing protein [Armatimonadota bacterium]|nr:transglutaminase domain-containing protein [Armatimonadota bacterium]